MSATWKGKELKMKSFNINRFKIAPGHPAMIIAEIGQAHDGSLGLAHAYIDAAAKAGVDAVKFQTHIAAAESTMEEPFRISFSSQDQSRYAYWKRMEFTPGQWAGLAEHAADQNLVFLSSPFSEQAVDLLEKIGVPAWKISSGEIYNPLLLRRLAKTGLPLLLSTGMSSIGDLDQLVETVKGYKLPFLLFQCSTSYPCPPEEVGLNLLSFLRERYNCPVGLSDHSGTIYPALAAAALGVEMIEVHLTLSREMFGPDVSSSLVTAELARLVDGVRFIEKVLANPVDKNQLAGEKEPLRRMFTKSLALKEDLPAGTVLEENHLGLKKPGTGIPPTDLEKLIGRKLKKNYKASELLKYEDLE